MSQITELFQQYLDMSDEDRVAIGRKNMREIQAFLNSELDRDTALTIWLHMLASPCCVDHTISRAEHKYIMDVTDAGLSYDDFYEMVKDDDAEIRDTLDQLVDRMPDDVKMSYLCLALCIFCADGTMTVDEQNYFQQLMD